VPCSKTIYCKKQHDLIKKLIAESAVIVATPSDDFELIVGYAVFEPEVLHWLYVKSSFRRMGVASELMKHSGLCDNFSYTHLPSSAIGRWFMDQGGVYNPYLLMGV
jgi:GNAT superfamily N-acetyltransferase